MLGNQNESKKYKRLGPISIRVSAIVIQCQNSSIQLMSITTTNPDEFKAFNDRFRKHYNNRTVFNSKGEKITSLYTQVEQKILAIDFIYHDYINHNSNIKIEPSADDATVYELKTLSDYFGYRYTHKIKEIIQIWSNTDTYTIKLKKTNAVDKINNKLYQPTQISTPTTSKIQPYSFPIPLPTNTTLTYHSFQPMAYPLTPSKIIFSPITDDDMLVPLPMATQTEATNSLAEILPEIFDATGQCEDWDLITEFNKFSPLNEANDFEIIESTIFTSSVIKANQESIIPQEVSHKIENMELEPTSSTHSIEEEKPQYELVEAPFKDYYSNQHQTSANDLFLNPPERLRAILKDSLAYAVEKENEQTDNDKINEVAKKAFLSFKAKQLEMPLFSLKRFIDSDNNLTIKTKLNSKIPCDSYQETYEELKKLFNDICISFKDPDIIKQIFLALTLAKQLVNAIPQHEQHTQNFLLLADLLEWTIDNNIRKNEIKIITDERLNRVIRHAKADKLAQINNTLTETEKGIANNKLKIDEADFHQLKDTFNHEKIAFLSKGHGDATKVLNFHHFMMEMDVGYANGSVSIPIGEPAPFNQLLETINQNKEMSDIPALTTEQKRSSEFSTNQLLLGLNNIFPSISRHPTENSEKIVIYSTHPFDLYQHINSVIKKVVLTTDQVFEYSKKLVEYYDAYLVDLNKKMPFSLNNPHTLFSSNNKQNRQDNENDNKPAKKQKRC